MSAPGEGVPERAPAEGLPELVRAEGLPELVIEDGEAAVVDLLRDLQRAALTHSEAARALFGAMVREGQLFGQTAEGRRWKERLQRSALLERALLVWQSATLWITEESAEGVTPSAVIDAVASAAASPRRDLLLDQVFRGTKGGL
jgi:hypothetical protein